MSHRAIKTRSPKWGRIIAILVILGIVFGAGYFAVSSLWGTFGDRILELVGKADNDFEGEGHGEVFITIYEGEIGGDVAATLEEFGVVKSSEHFYKMLLKKPSIEFMPGSYSLRLEMSSEAALTALQDPANKIERAAAIREGLTAEQTFEILAAGTGIPVSDFFDAAKDLSVFGLPASVDSLEGWLFPANYQFDLDDDATDMIRTLVEHQKQILESHGVPVEKQQEILTIASIIEKEAGIAADFAKVSRVIQNRLEIDMKLGMDSTAQFGVGEHDSGNVWSSDEALTSENPWNTYVHTGLPIGPIANPGEAAIIAALQPAEGEWLFFVVAPGGTGASTFSNTYEEHEEAEAAYRTWCSETPESGC